MSSQEQQSVPGARRHRTMQDHYSELAKVAKDNGEEELGYYLEKKSQQEGMDTTPAPRRMRLGAVIGRLGTKAIRGFRK